MSDHIRSCLQLELPPSVKKRRLNTNYELCILCQISTKSPLVNPQNYENLLECLKKRDEWLDPLYVNICRRLGNISAEELKQHNAKWHKECYKSCTHKNNMSRIKKKFEEGKKGTCQEEEEPSTSYPGTTYTLRSKIPIYDKNQCFFCGEGIKTRSPLYCMETSASEARLRLAVQLSNNEIFKVRLGDCVNPGDALAKKIKYHKHCWNKYVVNVLRPKYQPKYEMLTVHEHATDVEFISTVSNFLHEGKVTTMADIEEVYLNIAINNGMDQKKIKSRKQIKKLIEEELESVGVFFSNPKRVNEPQRVTLKVTADISLATAEDSFEDLDKDMKILFGAAKILRALVMKSKKWTFDGSIQKVDMTEVIPEQVYHFFKWCIDGQLDMNYKISREVKTSAKAKRISQVFMYEMLSPRQASEANNKNVRHTRDMPLQVAVGLTVHSETRSKFLIQFLHNLGTSVEYNKVLRIETQIANEVIKRMEANEGRYIPPDLVKGRFVFCAADNIDFQEDTPYGKGTLHGTIMVVYQEEIKTDVPDFIVLSEPATRRSLQTIPNSIAELSNISVSNCKNNAIYNIQSTVNNKKQTKQLLDSNMLEDLVWMMMQVINIKESKDITESPVGSNFYLDDKCNLSEGNEMNLRNSLVPTWSAYNSLVNMPLQKMRTCILPIIDSTPTSTAAQVTCMKKLEGITNDIVGPDSKTVVTFDLGLYKPVCQLAMANKNLAKNWVLRPGELHTVMAMLRAIGIFVDGTGIECALSDLYSETVLSQILGGKHVRRGIAAHTTLTTALFKCYIDLFLLQHEELKKQWNKQVKKLITVLQTDNIEEINSVHRETLLLQTKFEVLSKLEEFDQVQGDLKPTFKVARQYMKMVQTMLLYIRSVRTGNWELHLASLEHFVQYFFALNLRNYASMVTWYLSEIKQLENTDPDLWAQFMRGNWVVNNSDTPFCALGTDEALEQENRRMKVLGGLVNITQKKKALTKFFMTAPELSRIKTETKNMLEITQHDSSNHHQLTTPKSKRQINEIQVVYSAIINSTDPFLYDGSHLININSKAVFSDAILKDATTMSTVGAELYNTFKTERIESGKTNFWDKISKVKLNLCKTACKKVRTVIANKIVDIKSDRSLFTRLLVASRSRPDINLKQSLGTYEFSAVPRSMFALDGSQLLCTNKSNLMKLLEQKACKTDKCAEDLTPSDPDQKDCTTGKSSNKTPSDSDNSKRFTVAIIDGMAEVQAMKKPLHVKTCYDLAVEFNKKLDHILSKYDETHLVFDTYKEKSLKSFVREKRNGKSQAVQFKITDTTNIGKISLKVLLSHVKTKDDLTEYLSKKAIQFTNEGNKRLIVSWRETAMSTEGEVINDLKNNHEEADTKIILHALFASRRGATQLDIYSPDTDVFIISLWWSEHFPEYTNFVTGIGQKRRNINLFKIRESLGFQKTSALLGFHALSGCDTTGALAHKAKISFWKAFNAADNKVLEALNKLGSLQNFSNDERLLIEKFICQVYVPGTRISDIGELRWWMFTKKETQGENLPPTRGSLIPYISRVRYQTMQWQHADQPYPHLPSPLDYGWELEEETNHYIPIMCTLPCAPQDVLQIIRCTCIKGRCAPPCKCASHNLKCTEMCVCGGEEDVCDNHEELIMSEAIAENSDDEL